MPNWVFNTLDNYPKDIYDKYKSEDCAIDFNKIIPEPEEITNTVSGSYNDTAKRIVKYKEYINKEEYYDENYIHLDHNNPLRDEVRNIATSTSQAMGDLVIENPDTSLNNLLKEEDNKSLKRVYDEYVDIFGNTAYKNCTNFKQIYDNYIQYEENKFAQLDKESDFMKPYKQYDSLEDMGHKLIELKEKYGADNWYDWRNLNWGTKWNACHSNYNDSANSLTFDTAWSIPYPILAKMAEQNPDIKIDGYSEEETGWFDEYNLSDGQVNITATGENIWNEETDSYIENENTLDPPKVITCENASNDYKLLDKAVKFFI